MPAKAGYRSYRPSRDEFNPSNRRKKRQGDFHENAYHSSLGYRPSKRLRPSEDEHNVHTDSQQPLPPDFPLSTVPRHHPDANPPTSANQANAHTKKSRQNNPSTRIHSLRKLLATDILPPVQRRDKERELQTLLAEQEEAQTRKQKNMMVKRYHMVRFFERKKAERNLKRLQKESDEAIDDDGTGAVAPEMTKDIWNAKVDVNYTLYSPLAEKYVGLFPQDARGSAPKGKNKKRKQDTNDGETEQQRQERSDQLDDIAGLSKVTEPGAKPPEWYEVDLIMKHLTDDGKLMKRKLEELRDRKPASITSLAVRNGETGDGKVDKKKQNWLSENGHDNREDLDNEDDEEGGMRLDGNGNDDGDEDISDGGFFE